MKKKSLKLILLTLLMLIVSPSMAWATDGSLVLSPNPSGVAVNGQVVVTITAAAPSSSSGIESVEGTLVFDSNYLEFVSSEKVTDPYTIKMNSTYKIAGLNTDLEDTPGIKESTKILTVTFKALKAGTTQVTISNYELGEKGATLNTTVTPANITITASSGGSTSSKSNDATLKNLGVTGYDLSPAFDSNTTSYTVTVPNSTSSVTLTGAANSSSASVSGIGTVNLTGDSTTKDVVVTAEDGTKKTYTVTINKKAISSDATLKSLGVSGYSISPTFSSGTTEYSLTVPSTANEVIVNAITNDTGAKVSVSGNTNLKTGNNKVIVKVTAEDGTTKEYVINVNKEEAKDTTSLDGDNSLKSLNVGGYSLSPAFSSNITSYTIKVANNVNGLDVNAVANSSKAKVSITGNTGWKDGVNTISVKVTAENGNVRIYTVNAIRESASTTPTTNSSSNDNKLKSLTISSTHTIDKEFDPAINSYALTVPYEVDKLDLSYVTSNSKAKVEIEGNEDFKVGEANTVTIKVTAEDGSVNYYILNVTRSSEASLTDLEKLVIDGYDLIPEFDPRTFKYTVKIDGDTDELDISAIAKDKDSKVEIIGNENLKEGHNTILVKVTDKNGMVRYYEIDAVKEATKNTTILGMPPWLFGTLLGLLLLLLIFLIILLFKKKNTRPVIDFKPEFNFGSKNSSDDDVVHGNLNQESEIEYKHPEEKRLIEASDAKIEDVKEEDIPFDYYDETITKDEIVNAIHEAVKTKDTKKLRMLLDQDELNQRKKAMKKEEENKNKVDDDFWQ